MDKISTRLKALRGEMEKYNLDGWYIPGTDPHSGEYLPARWETRAFISGFTGSFGTIIVTMKEAVLWTDPRYFIQAGAQLQGTPFRMKKLRVPDADPPEQWLSRHYFNGFRLGYDPQTLTIAVFRKLKKALSPCGIELIETPDFFESLWENRPGIPEDEVFELGISCAGLTRRQKRELIAAELKRFDAEYLIVTALDELAWIFNLRGSDVPYNPVFTGFGVIGKNESFLFVNRAKVPTGIITTLENEGTSLLDYGKFFEWLQSSRGRTFLTDPASASQAVRNSIEGKNTLKESPSLIAWLKAQKNETELDGFREAMIKDGVALLEFLFWLKNRIGEGRLTEYIAGCKLAEFREYQQDFRGESFPPIVGYKDHGAIIHLSAGPEDALPLRQEGILLFDSGGQYLQGTTDVTRTVALGKVSKKQKTDFTLVLKGMIALTLARFPEGTKGCHLDILARQFLWEHGLNYGHGTGHGVGHFLNVHEGPLSVRQEYNPVSLQPGMVLSNEPGLYREGEYGIRIENMMCCVETASSEFGKFLGFETLTLCPIDTSLIRKDLLTEREKNWLNQYHIRVRDTLKSYLREELHGFLDELTRGV